jgi:hypothetical protein
MFKKILVFTLLFACLLTLSIQVKHRTVQTRNKITYYLDPAHKADEVADAVSEDISE